MIGLGIVCVVLYFPIAVVMELAKKYKYQPARITSGLFLCPATIPAA